MDATSKFIPIELKFELSNILVKWITGIKYVTVTDVVCIFETPYCVVLVKIAVIFSVHVTHYSTCVRLVLFCSLYL